MELGEHRQDEPPVPDCDCRRCAVATRDDLRKDAERYRWLRKHHDARIYEAGGFYRVEKYSLSWEESIDAAIDAAMAGANTTSTADQRRNTAK